MWRGILLLLLPVSQMRGNAALFGECNPLLGFVSLIFSYNTYQNSMTTVKL